VTDPEAVIRAGIFGDEYDQEKALAALSALVAERDDWRRQAFMLADVSLEVPRD
jgi:hypothetical protein